MISLNCRSFLVLAITLVCICAFRLSFTPKFQGRVPAKLGNGWKRSKSVSVNSVLSSELGTKPTPGSPIVRYVYSNSNLALLSIAVSGETTQKAFNQACEIFNEVGLSLHIIRDHASKLTSRQPFLQDSKGRKVSGFPLGAKLPYQILYDIYTEKQVKDACKHFLDEPITVSNHPCLVSVVSKVLHGVFEELVQSKFMSFHHKFDAVHLATFMFQDECEKSGLRVIGKPRMTEFNADLLIPGNILVVCPCNFCINFWCTQRSLRSLDTATLLWCCYRLGLRQTWQPSCRTEQGSPSR